MLNKIAACFFSCLFLLGNVFLPLCDFSLVQDIPQMYRDYEKIAAADEVGVADFIGDYLLAGKALLGHNKNDKPETSDNAVQFQHAPGASVFIYCKLEMPSVGYGEVKTTYLPFSNAVEAIGFYPELFRPPLV